MTISQHPFKLYPKSRLFPHQRHAGLPGLAHLLQRYLKKISDRTLSQNRKVLEADGLIHREVYPQIPPKVEYSLTQRGQSLMQVLDQLCVWGEQNRMDEPATF